MGTAWEAAGAPPQGPEKVPELTYGSGSVRTFVFLSQCVSTFALARFLPLAVAGCRDCRHRRADLVAVPTSGRRPKLARIRLVGCDSVLLSFPGLI